MMQRILFITIFLLTTAMAGAQSLRPAHLADTALHAPLPAYLLTPTSSIAPDGYYRQHFGYFCKKEWDWEKRTGVPVKLRLGNYEYTQKREGK
ncbi:hypothetical protein [uncultured Chitinophaga sp.]|jgi:hypothetical protein|uniref:hypothetical protein n=1 Tax=uncultured Chitinophaga sp. TaxID=339340 RepID=UPI00261A4127|nr:hypothetical protein [uncultured Chitinophaga sp.]